nr:hypothetical protein CFP56_50189 [Quercus suber]
MKSAKQSTETSKRPRGDVATTSGAMPAIEETFVDPTTAMDPVGGVETVDPTVAPPLSLRDMVYSIMITQAVHG